MYHKSRYGLLDEVELLVKQAVELANNRPEIIDTALATIREHQIPETITDCYLIELYNRLPVLQWTKIGDTIGAMNESQGRRTSNLGSSTIQIEQPFAWIV